MTDPTPLETVRPLVVVTGASSGIGYELARLLAEDGYDLVIAADRPLAEAVQGLEAAGSRVRAVQGDLATEEGVQALYTEIDNRPVDVLAANAGQGLGKASWTSPLTTFCTSSTPTSPARCAWPSWSVGTCASGTGGASCSPARSQG